MWTLEECVQHATENNLTIKKANLTTQLSEFSVQQSRLNLLPNLNASAAYYFNFGKTIDPTSNLFVSQNTQTNTLSLTSSVVLFSGFQKLNAVKQTEYDLQASRASGQKTIDDVQLNVVAAFLQVVFAKENLKISEEQAALSQQQLSRIQKLFDAGALTQSAFYDTEAQAAQDEVARINAANSLASAKLILAQLLNVMEPLDVSVPEINVLPEASSLNQTMYDIYEIALANQPAIRSAEFMMKSAEKGLSISKGRLYPSLSMFGSLSTNYSDIYDQLSVDSNDLIATTVGYLISDSTPVINYFPSFTSQSVNVGQQYKDNFGQAFGFSLDIPLFNNWQTRTNVSRSKVELLDAQYNLEAARQQLLTDVQNAYQNAVAAKNSYDAAIKAVSSFQRSFDDAQRKLDAGAINTFDYATIKTNYLKAQSDLLQAKYQYIFNLKVLDFYQGKPITLH